MPLPLLPVAIGSLACAAYAVNKGRQPKPISAEAAANRTMIFDTALNTCKDSDKLRILAEAFNKEGARAEALMLCKRAELIDAPPEMKAARREALSKGLASTNKDGVLRLADAFEELGATAAAAKLREHAATIDMAAATHSNPRI